VILLVSQLKKISEFAKYYESMILFSYNLNKLKKNWLDALEFFFHCVFFGGRRDNLSREYKDHTFKIIKSFFTNEKNLNVEIIGKIDDKLMEKTPGGKKFPGKDRKMVKEILEKLLEIQNNNIVTYTLNYLEKWDLNGIEKIYNEIKEIFNIGRKKTTLFLRDLVDIFNLEDLEMAKQYKEQMHKYQMYKYFQPIDVWVSRVAKHFGINSNLYDDNKALQIVKKCLESEEKVSPIKFNQGAWLMGWICGQIIKVEDAINNLDTIERIIKCYNDIKKSIFQD